MLQHLHAHQRSLYLCTYASSTNDRELRISLWTHCDVQVREETFQFILVFLGITYCVHIHLKEDDTSRI